MMGVEDTVQGCSSTLVWRHKDYRLASTHLHPWATAVSFTVTRPASFCNHSPKVRSWECHKQQRGGIFDNEEVFSWQQGCFMPALSSILIPVCSWSVEGQQGTQEEHLTEGLHSRPSNHQNMMSLTNINNRECTVHRLWVCEVLKRRHISIKAAMGRTYWVNTYWANTLLHHEPYEIMSHFILNLDKHRCCIQWNCNAESFFLHILKTVRENKLYFIHNQNLFFFLINAYFKCVLCYKHDKTESTKDMEGII